MAVQYQYFVIDGESHTFSVTKPIKTKSLTNVFGKRKDNNSWDELFDFQYDVINNSIVLNEDFINIEDYNTLEVRVADNPDELTLSPSYLNLIIKYLPEILRVAINIEDVVNVSDNIVMLRIVANNLLQVNIVAQNINDVITVATNIANVNSVANNMDNINIVVSRENEIVTISDNINLIDIVAQNINEINAVATNISDVINVSQNLDDIQTIIPDIPLIEIVALNIDNVNAVAQNETNITAVAQNETNINLVVQNETNINTVASNIDNVNAVGDNIDNVNAVAQNETNINLVVQNETNINTVASNIDNVNAVSDNIDNVNLVALNEANINTVSSNITDVNNVSSNITDVNNVSSNMNYVQSVGSEISSIIVVADNIDVITEAYSNAMNSYAKSQSSLSFSSQPYGENVRDYYYDPTDPDNPIKYNEINTFSSFHYALESRLHSSGITLLGVWDSVDCNLPPNITPDMVPDGESANGYTYIVKSVTDSSGNPIECPDGMSVGDWIVWFGDDTTTDDVIEGQWYLVNWTFDWSSIVNVPENVQNAVSRLGDTMTGDLNVYGNVSSTDGVVMTRLMPDRFEVKLVDNRARFNIKPDETTLSMDFKMNDDTTMSLPYMSAPETKYQPTEINSLTRKDYVDGKTGRVKSWADIGLDDSEFAGLDVVGALQLLDSKLEIGQEVEEYMYDQTYNNFISIFPEAEARHTKIVRAHSDMFRFEYTHYNNKTSGYRTFYNFFPSDSLEDSGYVEVITDEGGIINGTLYNKKNDAIIISNIDTSTSQEYGGGIQFDVDNVMHSYIRYQKSDNSLTIRNGDGNNTSGVFKVEATGNVSTSASQPTNLNHLTRKDYVDNNFVNKAGDTIEGDLLLDTSVYDIRIVKENDYGFGLKFADNALILGAKSGAGEFRIRPNGIDNIEKELIFFNTGAVLFPYKVRLLNNNSISWNVTDGTDQSFMYLSTSDNLVVGNARYNTVFRGLTQIFEANGANVATFTDSNIVFNTATTIDRQDGQQLVLETVAGGNTVRGVSTSINPKPVTINPTSEDGSSANFRFELNGQLTLPVEPTADMSAVTKLYVDGLTNSKYNYGIVDKLQGDTIDSINSQGAYYFVNQDGADNPADELNGMISYVGDDQNAMEVLSTQTTIYLRERIGGTWGEWNQVSGGSNYSHNDLLDRDLSQQHPFSSIYQDDAIDVDLNTALSNKSNIDHTHSEYATTNDLDAHTSNTSNPHNVTANQVGAPNGSWVYDESTNTLTITIP